MWHMQSLRWTVSLVKAGVLSGWHVHINMSEAGQSQKKRVRIGHLQTRARPWPKCMFLMLLSNNGPLTMCSNCAVSRLVCGWSHPSGVWYLIAWIDRPKESVTFSWYHGKSQPNKSHARTKHRILSLYKMNMMQHKPTREKEKRNCNELCWYWSSGRLFTGGFHAAAGVGVEVGFPFSAIRPWRCQLFLQTRHRGF